VSRIPNKQYEHPEADVLRHAIWLTLSLCFSGCSDSNPQVGTSPHWISPEDLLSAESQVDFVRPRDLAAGPGFHLILDHGTGQIAQIEQIDDKMRVVALWGTLGEGPQEFIDPSALAVLMGDTIAVLERGRRSIRYWTNGRAVASTRLSGGNLPVSLEPRWDGTACWASSEAFMECAGPGRPVESKGRAPPPPEIPGFPLPPLLRRGQDRVWYRYENDRGSLFRMDASGAAAVPLPEDLAEALAIPQSVFQDPGQVLDLGRGGVSDFVVLEDGGVIFALQHAQTSEMVHWDRRTANWHTVADISEDPGILRLSVNEEALFALRPASLTRYPLNAFRGGRP